MTDIANFAAYDGAGKILFVVSCATDMSEFNMKINGFSQYVEVPLNVRAESHYLPEGKLEPRPEMNAVLKGNVLVGVVADSTLLIEGRTYTADGSDIELEFTHDGDHVVNVSHWPYQDQEFKVENPT